MDIKWADNVQSAHVFQFKPVVVVICFPISRSGYDTERKTTINFIVILLFRFSWKKIRSLCKIPNYGLLTWGEV